MTAAMLLDRLDGVRATGHDRWIARCPAHADERPSLSVREGDRGAVLMHCFAGCDVSSIAAAVGLNLSDLFPPRASNVHAARPRVSALTPLVARFELDLLLVHILLADIAAGNTIPPIDCASAKAAADRIYAALQEARRVI